MKKALAVVDLVNERVGRIASFSLLALIGIVTYEVVARYVFGSPTMWAHESSGFAFLLLVVLTGAWVLREGGHIRVDVIRGRFPPRMQALADMVSSIPYFVFASALLWKGLGFAWRSTLLQETSNTVFAPPLWPLKIAIVLGALLLLLQGISEFVRSFNSFSRGGS